MEISFVGTLCAITDFVFFLGGEGRRGNCHRRVNTPSGYHRGQKKAKLALFSCEFITE